MEYPWSEPSISAEQFQELAGFILPAELLEQVLRLVSASDLAAHLTEYSLSPVLSFQGGDLLETRVCVSNVHHPIGWREAVLKEWAGAEVGQFLERAPEATRRMVELGGAEPVFYLDDLHEVAAADRTWIGELLCMRFYPDTARLETFHRHSELAEAIWRPLLELCGVERTYLPNDGLWGVSSGSPSDEARQILFVTETRTRRAIRDSILFLKHSVAAEHVKQLAKASGNLGVRLYLDSLELRRDGRADFTLGFLGPS